MEAYLFALHFEADTPYGLYIVFIIYGLEFLAQIADMHFQRAFRAVRSICADTVQKQGFGNHLRRGAQEEL